jgi:hypothetical protein
MQNDSYYIFRYYDGEERSKNNSGWKNVNENHLKAARGYIFQSSATDVLILDIADVKFKKLDKYNELCLYVSENIKDASWNFVGNPYLCYYDINDLNFDAPITVWDGEKYVALRPGDDDYHLAPYEAFFVQKPEDQATVGYDGEKQMTGNQSKAKLAEASKARTFSSMTGEQSQRMLVNLVLSNETSSDRTRVVFNNNQSMAYEVNCDAAKFETAGVVQLFTIDTNNVRYAINERPVDNGVVTVGYTVPVAGTYTIEAKRMDTPVFIKDNKTGLLHDLSKGAYSFTSEACTSQTRFQLLTRDNATAIGKVDADSETIIYDMSGRRVKKTNSGVYVVNGEKCLEK